MIAAKAFAAWQVRRALALPLPSAAFAQMHIDYQRQSYEAYLRSVWAERDLERGAVQQILPMERALQWA